ncbi:glycerol-3-phosphate 1-O-acyltransferase PlsY [Emcibacter nanhaiensis]|uniref:Glycerol-3-phosphate acyltransferase n=1 Tax=Emcibacter nanhaiensis TaxID=1505037 RepID=A0A501PTW1_9PROT|nr:glycerol-3-phosphate 1-O-acyltransferase PlsY [Emcibacter nanhaiensis]TPD63161.1 glycerol-3-phosphate 1-O-acyltransferase PlsY [Emcibacter nanhaiensis]
MELEPIILIAALAGGYLLGSIPFGLVLTRLAGHGDIRNIGSGNIGATNVLRTGNKFLAFLTVILDGGKGAAAALIAEYLTPGAGLFAGGAAFIGHIYPVWLKFRGGKGMATFLGTMLALSWPAGIACCLTWLVIALTFRISSLSALVAALLSPLYSYYISGTGLAILSCILCVLIFLRHKDNIKRLLQGTEPRIGKKS